MYALPPFNPFDPPGSAKLRNWAHVSMIGIFIILIVVCLYLASTVLIPLAAALLVSFAVAPLQRPLVRKGFPAPILAAFTLVTLVTMGILVVIAVSTPAMEWVDRAPRVSSQLREKFRPVIDSFADLEKASNEVAKIADFDKKPSATMAAASPPVMGRLLTGIQQIGVSLFLVMVLLYFLLASGDMFKEKTVRLMPTFRDKRAVVEIVTTIEREVSSYLLTITAINLALGAVVGAGLYLLGLENALFWGMVIAVLNFIPYVGAIVGIGLVTVAALLQFPDAERALMVPLIYFACHILEGSFITPSLLGRRFTINPIIMFFSVVIWTWLWGIPGALMAVPMTVVMNVIFSHIPSLNPLHEYISGTPRSRAVIN
ncbi:MAG: AI-2E family transporter [Sphingomonadales bacterium]